MHMRSITHAYADRDSAQALVEFAFILPIMLILVLGSIDVGRALVYGVSVQGGAHDAARLAVNAGGDPLITDTVVLQRLIDASKQVLGDCQPITTRQACGGGFWTFSIEVDTPSRPKANPWLILNNLGTPPLVHPSGARTDPAFSGSMLTVTATGEVSVLAGLTTVVPGTSTVLTLFPITARGQTIMMVL